MIKRQYVDLKAATKNQVLRPPHLLATGDREEAWIYSAMTRLMAKRLAAA
jgi:hypothetical protein